VALFFINTESGQVATEAGLEADGICRRGDSPPRPWHRIQGSDDATTLWYAVMRRRQQGIVLGSLVFRRSEHHACLAADGWEEVPLNQISGGPDSRAPSPI